MAIQQFASANTVAVVTEKIKAVASGRPCIGSAQTCWNAVGLYLQQHASTLPPYIIWFYGVAPIGDLNTEIVSHVMLTDVFGRVLRDTVASRGGKMLQNGARYQDPLLPEPWALMTSVRRP